MCIQDKEEEVWKRISKRFVKNIQKSEPKTFVEAVIEQHPDLDAAMDKLALQMAKCLHCEGGGGGEEVQGVPRSEEQSFSN